MERLLEAIRRTLFWICIGMMFISGIVAITSFQFYSVLKQNEEIKKELKRLQNNVLINEAHHQKNAAVESSFLNADEMNWK